MSDLGGGIKHHKPGCNCICCKPRPREKKALPIPAGGGRTELVPSPAQVARQHEGAEPDPTSPAYNSVQPIRPDAISYNFPLPTTFKVRGLGKQYHGVARQHVADWITIRMQDPDITMTEAAKRLNIGRNTLYRAIAQGRAQGWLKLEDPIDRIEYEIIPKTVDNLNYFLDKKDKAVTIEAAKGTIFKQFQEAKGLLENSNTTVLALKIESLPLTDGAPAKFITGQIIGKPRELQVIDVKPDEAE